MFQLPELPQPIYKVAIAHRSLKPEWDPEYGDAEWLGTIGRMVLPAVVAEVLSSKKPLLQNMRVRPVRVRPCNTRSHATPSSGRDRQTLSYREPRRMDDAV